MATVIFDFDSTLIQKESLEEILAFQLRDNPEGMARIEAITREGMEGKIDFAQSLSRRLEIAAPTLADVQGFAAKNQDLWTPGLQTLIASLIDRGVIVRIVSGGLRESILPFGAQVGIPPEQVHAVSLLWDADGRFAGIDPNDSFSQSKVKGVAPLIDAWPGPRVAVGDGMTDYHLKRDGFVDHFIAYTENVRRDAVVALGTPEAASASQLKEHLERIL